jgi:NADH-ubiquinone oxidoreductase chain 1
MQRRLGPNKVGIYGLLQPLADGGKLFLKETVIPAHANIGLFLLAPILTLTFSLLGWMVIPFNNNTVIFDTPLGILFVLAISSLGIYGVIFSGWAANSKYAFLGSLRSTAQMISYEVVLGLIILTVVFCLGETPNLAQIVISQQAIWYIIPLAPLGILFFISALAETNRPPFDLPEAESELVAGYFTEHSSIPFAYFFLGEYSSILLISTLTVILFLGGWLTTSFIDISPAFSSFVLGLKVSFIFFSFIWVRATFPRWKYTQLIVICWTSLLPLTLGFVTIVPAIILTLT